MANAKQAANAANGSKANAGKAGKPAAKAGKPAAKAAPAAKASGAYIDAAWSARLVVRGRTERNGAVLRRVRTVEVQGADLAAATKAAERIGAAGAFAEMAAEAPRFVETTTMRVYPPVGLLVRGGVSKGFGTLPGASLEKAIAGKAALPVFVGREHKAGEAAPADVAAQYR